MTIDDLERFDCINTIVANEYGKYVRYDDVVELIKYIESNYKKYEEEKNKKKMAEDFKKIENYFANITPEQMRKAMYEREYAALKQFDRHLWEKMIDEQLEFSDEDLFYSNDDILAPFKDVSFFFSVDNALTGLKTQHVDESDFPTMVYIVKHNDKEMFVVTMVGQGSVTDTCTREHFLDWMTKCDNKFTIDDTKVYTVDDLEKLVSDAIEANKDLDE